MFTPPASGAISSKRGETTDLILGFTPGQRIGRQNRGTSGVRYITLPLGVSSLSEERAPRTWPSPAATASDPPAVREGEVFVLQPLENRTNSEVVVLIASSNGASPANRPPLPHVVVLL